MTKPRGRPPRNVIVPHPLKAGEWLQIGGFDKHWPAANWYWCQVRDGMPRAKALESAALKFNVEEQSLVDWLHRARKRGCSGGYDEFDGESN